MADTVQGWRNGLASGADKLAKKWGNGTYEEKSNVADKVDSLITDVSTGLLWNTTDAWNTGMEHGGAAKDWMNNIGSKFQNTESDIKNKTNLPNVTDPTYDVTGAYNVPDNLTAIKDNTDDINDNLDLAEDDLEFLRNLAEMEWRNEFTTAEIKVEMVNNNSINSELDMDGVVSHLSTKLREEMTSVAYGVHY